MWENHICKKCGGIAGWDPHFQSWICTRCGNEKPKLMSNADRIRAMTDKDLAEAIGDSIDCSICKHMAKTEDCPDKCYKHWLDWLQQETKE